MTAILLAMFGLFAPEPQKPLEAVGWLVGGQWESTAKLPDGRPIETRTVWSWGPARQSMRGRTYVRNGDEEVLQYETVIYWHPQRKRVESVTWALLGPVTRGTGTIEGNKLTLEQPAKQFPAMKSVWKPDPEDRDRYEGINFWKQGGEWREVMSAASVRKPEKALEKMETRSPAARRLDPLERFVGEWEWTAGDEKQSEVVERSQHGGLLHNATKGRWAWIYHDPEKRTLLSLGFDARGGVTRTIVSPEDGVVRMAGIEWVPGEKKKEFRAVVTWKDQSTYEYQPLTKEGEKAGPAWTATRRSP